MKIESRSNATFFVEKKIFFCQKKADRETK